MKLTRVLLSALLVYCGCSFINAQDIPEDVEDLYSLYHRIFLDTSLHNTEFIELLAEIYYRLPETTAAERALKQKLEKQFEAKFHKLLRQVKLPVQNIEKMPPQKILLNLTTIFDSGRYLDLTKRILESTIIASRKHETHEEYLRGKFIALYDAYLTYKTLKNADSKVIAAAEQAIQDLIAKSPRLKEVQKEFETVVGKNPNRPLDEAFYTQLHNKALALDQGLNKALQKNPGRVLLDDEIETYILNTKEQATVGLFSWYSDTWVPTAPFEFLLLPFSILQISNHKGFEPALLTVFSQGAQRTWDVFVGKNPPVGKEYTLDADYYGFQREAMLNFIVSRLEMILNDFILLAQKVLSPKEIKTYKDAPRLSGITAKLKALLCGKTCSSKLAILNCDQSDEECLKNINSTFYAYFVFTLLLYGSLSVQQNTKLIDKAVKALEDFIDRFGVPSQSLKLQQVPFVLNPYPQA